jgi:arsenate reductase (thioredoxin)
MQTVLFLCPHGAAKSVIAAAYFEQLAKTYGLEVSASCAGTEPDPTLAPAVVALLARDGLVPPVEKPQRVDEELLAGAARVISLGCAREELPSPPHQWEQWDDIPPPSQDLTGAFVQIQHHLIDLIHVLREEQDNRRREQLS